MVLFTITACVVVCAVFYAAFDAVAKLVRKLTTRDNASKFEGPPSLPIIGSAHLFIGGGEAVMNRLLEFEKLYSKPYRMFLGNYLFFVTSNPDQMKILFHNPKIINRGDVLADFGLPLFGLGLITAPASIWRVHRKLIQPTFGLTILKSFLKTFAAKAVILTKQIEHHVGRPEFEMFRYLSLCAMDTICETAMGVDVEAQTKEDCRYIESLRMGMASGCTRIFSPWLHPDFIFYRTKLGKIQQQCVEYVQGFNEDCTEPDYQQTNSSIDSTGDTTSHREAFLDHLIKISEKNKTLTDQAIHDEVNTFIMSGSDTAPIAMSFLFLMLASHQNIQENVYEELCEIYGDEDSGELSITVENLSRMVYLERVIKETLRLFPIVPFTLRKVTEDFNIGEHNFPKGSTFILSIIGVHRSEKYWVNPLKFDPDRFLPENFAKQHPYSFIPFSGGPRNCIGYKYAMLLMKTITATLLRTYVLTKDDVIPTEKIRIKVEFELQPVVPITLGIKRRARKTTIV